MQHEILLKPSYSVLRCTLSRNEELHAESGAMLGMDASVTLEGKMKGGLFGGLKRAFLTSESFFVTTVRAQENGSEILLAPRATGDVEALELKNEEYLVQGGSFLASSAGIESDAKFTGWKGFLSGEGIFMIKVRGTGTLFVSSFGGILRKEIPAGKTFVIDNGHIVAFPSSMRYEIQRAGAGMWGAVTTGEGLVTVFEGPGAVLLQTRNLRSFVEALNPFLPDRRSSQGRGLLGQVMGG
ncbi:MAG: TIGR00266 family protein [Candidatus Peribacteraceae bacterium]|nr:TIGR00266 family protein [Candidatus Peribacteraceae bacterium]